MNLREFIEKITYIENKIDLSKLKVYDFNPWPYIRLIILKEFNAKNISINSDKGIFVRKSRLKQFQSFIKSFVLYIKNPIKAKNIDIIYFTRLSESQDLISNKLFNKYSDSFRSVFKNDYEVQVIEMSDQEFNDDKEYYNKDIIYIDFIIKMMKIKYKLLLLLNPTDKFIFNDTYQEIEISFGVRVSVDEELRYINILSLKLMKIIKYYNPKLVFLTVFYRIEAMAMSLACHRLGIKTVEYQHGAQNDFHAMYTNWNNLPLQGYELIPDWFWMWGTIPKSRIDKWAENTTKHQAVVGGNIWITYYRQTIKENNNLNMKYKKEKINILVSLQGDNFFPEFLLESIKNNQSNILWNFRDHPRLPISDELKNKIMMFSNTEIDFSTKTPLYELLQVTDIHVTGYSTVAFEAQSFNIPTIFIHPNAKDGYNLLINKNGLFYAESSEELTILIKKLGYKKENIKPDYIVSDLDTHQNALDELMENR